MGKNEIPPEAKIVELLELGPEAEAIFKQLGFHCLDCIVADADTVREAAALHNRDLDEVLAALRPLASKLRRSGQQPGSLQENRDPLRG